MKTPLSRRNFLKTSALAVGAGLTEPLFQPRAHVRTASGSTVAQRRIASGPFQPTWESLGQNYRCPRMVSRRQVWHLGPLVCPMRSRARRLVREAECISRATRSTTTTLRPTAIHRKFGFMEIDNLWKAERWEPEKLMALYKRAGAKYFFGLANHHDNFDAYDSKYHAWNSVNVGPKKDIVGTWAKVARANGLRFGVSNHSAHAWHWFQVRIRIRRRRTARRRALRCGTVDER